VSPKHSTPSDANSTEPVRPKPVLPTSAASVPTAVALVPGELPSIGTLVSEASAGFSTLLRGEIELAKLEVTTSVKNAGTGVVMFVAAAVLLVFSLIFGLIALAEGLVAAHLWRWVAYLIVFGALILLAAVAALLGLRKVKKVKAPAETIATTKDSVTAVKRAVASS
jgi:uncharacterized membrane protein YqjE